MDGEDGNCQHPGTEVRAFPHGANVARFHARQRPRSLTAHSFRTRQRRHVFGAKGDVRDNVHFVDETTVLYAAGNQIVLHHVESNVQSFVPGAPDTEGITALALSPNRKYLAIAERAAKATISVLDLTTHAKRRKVLSTAEVNAEV